jgi:hypothetical protein
MRPEPLNRIHERLLRDLGGPSTPVDSSIEPEERESMQKRLWGPLARDLYERTLITPRWDEYNLKRRLKFEAPVRRYTRTLIDTFWAGYSVEERRGLEKDVMEIYLDPEEATQAMPFSLGFLIHQTVHLITTSEEFTSRLVHQIVTTSSIEAWGKKRIPASWEDPVDREIFPWWGLLMELDTDLWPLVKHLRGNRIYYWLGARVLELHRGGRPLAGRFADLYLFFRSHLPPTRIHLRWIDKATTTLATLRAPGDRRPLESGEVEEAWESLPRRVAALKPGAIELMLKGGFVTDHFFGART